MRSCFIAENAHKSRIKKRQGKNKEKTWNFGTLVAHISKMSGTIFYKSSK